MARLAREYIAKKIFRPIVLELLKLPPDDPDTVRFPYGSSTKVGSAPGPSDRTRDLCYISVTQGGNPYGDQHHVSAQDTDPDSDKLTYVDEYTEVHSVLFTFYGPSSDLWSTTVRDGLFQYHIKEILRKSSLALVLPIPPIRWLPELKDGEWWRRHDLATTFYEAVRVEIPNSIGTIETFNIQAVSENTKRKEL